MAGDGTFHDVCAAGDLADGETRPVRVAGREILLCRVDGSHYAVDNQCTHAEFALDEGCLDGVALECPLHGARFDVRDGSVLAPPARDPLPVHAVRVVGGRVQVCLRSAG